MIARSSTQCSTNVAYVCVCVCLKICVKTANAEGAYTFSCKRRRTFCTWKVVEGEMVGGGKRKLLYLVKRRPRRRLQLSNLIRFLGLGGCTFLPLQTLVQLPLDKRQTSHRTSCCWEAAFLFHHLHTHIHLFVSLSSSFSFFPLGSFSLLLSEPSVSGSREQWQLRTRNYTDLKSYKTSL